LATEFLSRNRHRLCQGLGYALRLLKKPFIFVCHRGYQKIFAAFYPSCSLRPSFYFSVLRYLFSSLAIAPSPLVVLNFLSSTPRLSFVYSSSNLVLPVLLGGLSSSPAITSLSLFSICRSTSHSLTLPDCLFICQASASLTPFALVHSSLSVLSTSPV
jgi:hypothetical protein